MKNLPLFNLFGFFVVLTFSSCSKDDEPAPEQSTAVEITVKDGNSWTSNTEMDVVSGAVIKIYNTQEIANPMTPKYIATTDQAGKALIQVDFKNEYFFTVQKGNAKKSN